MSTGGGHSNLEESFSILGIPVMTKSSFVATERDIGSAWERRLLEAMAEAGREERRLAEERGQFHEGVPAITVVVDGGWSKRSHKHSYNAKSGVGIIIGMATHKLLYLGVRNKYCSACAQNIPREKHKCFKNWTKSSSEMETDIILEGFLEAERVHGVRYTKFVGDGDSSVYPTLLQNVPGWGFAIKKLECANHACKCYRGALERLVQDNPSYKGNGGLTLKMRKRLVSAARSAIRMRSKQAESDPKKALALLKKDLRNGPLHCFGHHQNCSSDFCKTAAASNSTSSSSLTAPSSGHLSKPPPFSASSAHLGSHSTPFSAHRQTGPTATSFGFTVPHSASSTPLSSAQTEPTVLPTSASSTCQQPLSSAQRRNQPTTTPLGFTVPPSASSTRQQPLSSAQRRNRLTTTPIGFTVPPSASSTCPQPLSSAQTGNGPTVRLTTPLGFTVPPSASSTHQQPLSSAQRRNQPTTTPLGFTVPPSASSTRQQPLSSAQRRNRPTICPTTASNTCPQTPSLAQTGNGPTVIPTTPLEFAVLPHYPLSAAHQMAAPVFPCSYYDKSSQDCSPVIPHPSLPHLPGESSSTSDQCLSSVPSDIAPSNSEIQSSVNDQDILDIVSDQEALWAETVNNDPAADLEARQGGLTTTPISQKMLYDIQVLLSRLIGKAEQLIGNVTTNLAESWMNIRAKFDGGKFKNLSQSGAWGGRCMGAGLRQNLGREWGPQAWRDVTKSSPNQIFVETAKRSARKLERDLKRKATDEAKERRRKSKYAKNDDTAAARSAYSRHDGGISPDQVTEDVSPDYLEILKQNYYDTKVVITREEARLLEEQTRQQSGDQHYWH